MVVATNTVAQRFEDVQAGVPINATIPLYDESEAFVYYGKASLVAVQNVDYTVTLGEDFNTFEVTPTAALIEKIDALISADPTETNYITVRRTLGYTTEATPAGVRNTQFTSDEFDRLAMKLMQLSEAVERTFSLPPSAVGGAVNLQLAGLEPGHVLMANEDGTAFVPGPDASAVADANANAVAAEQSAIEAAASAAAALAKENSMLRWRGAWQAGVAYAPSDIVHAAGSAFVCVVAHTAGTGEDWFTVWNVFAAQGAAGPGTGDMLKSENLSGLTNKAFARNNLELNALASATLTGTKNATTVLHGDDAYRPLLASYLVTLTASGTWNKPAGYADNALVIIEMWGGGGGGGHDGGGQYRAGGGGGGGYTRVELPYSSIAASCAYTIGAGGTTGDWGGGNGGNTVFAINGSWTETAYGGGGGAGGAVPSKGGGGGGRYQAGQHGDQGGGGLHNGGSGAAGDARYKAGFDGGGGGGGSGYKPQTGGQNNPVPAEAATRGGCAVEGGGGGGSCGANAGDNGPRTPGLAAGGFGGRGGWGAWGGAAEAGVTPGGGGGANGGGGTAGAGARGEIRIRIIP